jgi:hypothetical protein
MVVAANLADEPYFLHRPRTLNCQLMPTSSGDYRLLRQSPLDILAANNILLPNEKAHRSGRDSTLVRQEEPVSNEKQTTWPGACNSVFGRTCLPPQRRCELPVEAVVQDSGNEL